MMYTCQRYLEWIDVAISYTTNYTSSAVKNFIGIVLDVDVTILILGR
jgi:hypothetical protein